MQLYADTEMEPCFELHMETNLDKKRNGKEQKHVLLTLRYCKRIAHNCTDCSPDCI